VNWGNGMSAGCTAGPIVFADAGNGWPHSIDVINVQKIIINVNKRVY